MSLRNLELHLNQDVLPPKSAWTERLQVAAANPTPAVATLATMAGRRPVKTMLRRLHLHPVGFWLRGDATRRGYSPDEWTTLVCAASPDAVV